jgi:hypothetical protein
MRIENINATIFRYTVPEGMLLMDELPEFAQTPVLLADIRQLIEDTRTAVSTTVNSGLTLLYWRIGKRIHEEILRGGRADYGAATVASLGSQLEKEFGRGFSAKSLRHMVRFAEAFPDFQIVSALLRQLTWRVVVVELKIGDFKPADTGQVELYLRWLDKYERQPGEEAPLGIILCAGKKQEQVELLELGKSGIHVAEYMTELPSRELLQAKLHAAIQHARARLAQAGPQEPV